MADEDLFGLTLISIGLILGVVLFIFKSSADTNAKIKTYQNQLNTYVLCVQKAQDKSICGKQPDIKNYLQ